MTEHADARASAGASCSLAHTGRDEAREVARAFAKALTANGIVVRLLGRGGRPTSGSTRPAHGIEIADGGAPPAATASWSLVIGGDGTILRAAELTHGTRHPGAGGQPRPRRVPRRGGVRRPRVDDRRDRAPPLHLRGPAHARRDRSTATARWSTQHLRAQRGQRREGRPRADARGRRRDRRPPALALGLRRRRLRDADRLHRLQLQRRRARSCGPGSRRC